MVRCQYADDSQKPEEMRARAMRVPAVVLMIAVELATGLQVWAQQDLLHAYQPAMYSSIFGLSQGLMVFPLNSKAFSIPIPFPVGMFAYSPDGKALYAEHMFDPRTMLNEASAAQGLFKIEFDPVRVSAVAGSNRFFPIYSLAVSARQDKIIVLGFAAGGRQGVCGLFELSLASGTIRTIIENFASAPIDPAIYAADLSLSPDGRRVAATRDRRLVLIDVANGSVSPLGEGIDSGSWSPDGKWLAGLKGEATILIDALTLKERRALGATLLRWSPDAKYLLNVKSQLRCGLGEAGTLEMVDIQTGKRTEVPSSRCLIDRHTLGWLSAPTS